MRLLPLFAIGFLFAASAGPAQEMPALSSDDQARLQADPFFQSFSEAFDEVLAEEAPDLRNTEPEHAAETDPAAAAVLSISTAQKRGTLFQALAIAAESEHRPGSKVRRSFIFAQNEKGGWSMLETGGIFDMTPGDLLRTDGANDAAVEGEGFFRLTVPASGKTVYTRAGHFRAEPDGSFTAVFGEETFVLDTGETGSLASVPLFRFANPEYLASDDSVLFTPTEKSGAPALIEENGETAVRRGYLENSNARTDLILNELKRLDSFPLAENRQLE